MSETSSTHERPPLRRDAERNRERILAAARGLIAERGLGVGYEEIAREADVGVGTVYRRFPTRDGLYYELFYDRVDAVEEILKEALALEDAWEGLCHFIQRDFELQSSDRGLREFMIGRSDNTELGRSWERLHPLIARLVERAHSSGRLRAEVGESDIEIILATVGGLMDASIHVDPELWRRYLAMILNGIQNDARQDEIPGKPPDRSEVELILARWVAPRRGKS